MTNLASDMLNSIVTSPNAEKKLIEDFKKAAMPVGEDSEPCTKGDLKKAINAIVSLISGS